MKIEQKPIAIEVPTKTKTCKACGRTGPVNELFNRNVKSKDGYLHVCKDCFAKTHRKSHQEKDKTTTENYRTMEKDKTTTENYRTMELAIPKDIFDRLALVSCVKMRSMGNQLLYCFVQAYPEDDE